MNRLKITFFLIIILVSFTTQLIFTPKLLSQEPSFPLDKVFTLEECIQIALKYHPKIMASLSEVESSRARLDQTKSKYLPQLELNSSYSKTTSSEYSTSFSLDQYIYDFGRTASKVKLSKENLNVSQENADLVRQEIILKVKEAYYGLLRAQRVLKVNQEMVGQMEEHLKQAQGFFEVGVRPKIEVTKAEVDLANAELNLIKARNALQLAQLTLNNALGLEERLNYQTEDILGFKKVEINLEEALKEAFNHRPEILELKAKKGAYEASLEVARSDYFPILAGNASYGWKGNDFPLEKDWTVGTTLSFPLFNGFYTAAQIREAKSNLLNLKAQEQDLKLQIKLEVEQAYLSLKEAEERITTAAKTVIQAQENLELAEGRYRVGVGSPLEFTDAQVSFTQAKTNHIQALYDYKLAEAELIRAMGRKGD